MSIQSIPHVPQEISPTITYKMLTGQEIVPYIKEMGKLIMDVYAEWPYLYQGTEEEQRDYIQSRYIDIPESLVCAVFNKQKLIGLGMGVPLSKVPTYYLTPFKDSSYAFDLPLQQIFYWGELIVDPQYRQQKVARQICSLVGDQIRFNSNYKAIAFCTVEHAESFHLSHLKPAGAFSTELFWNKLGFLKHENIVFTGQWQLLGEKETSQHHMIYWSKLL